jgi:recombinational DNA repair protein (RecF pathway)
MAFTACESVNSLTAESQVQPEVYALLSRFLTHLNTGKPINNAVFEFQKKLLKLLGFGVPDNSTSQSLETFIEEIIGHSLKSPEITA